jgi:hypothetical protein
MRSFFDSQAPLQLYDSFAHSPVLKQFTFSSTVLGILNRFMPELAPESSPYDLDRAERAVSAEPIRMGGPWRHVLALHLRRGADWEAVCERKGHSTSCV